MIFKERRGLLEHGARFRPEGASRRRCFYSVLNGTERIPRRVRKARGAARPRRSARGFSQAVPCGLKNCSALKGFGRTARAAPSPRGASSPRGARLGPDGAAWHSIARGALNAKRPRKAARLLEAWRAVLACRRLRSSKETHGFLKPGARRASRPPQFGARFRPEDVLRPLCFH